MSDDFKNNLELALGNAKRLSNKILIDGKLSPSKAKGKISVLNPSTGENIGEAPQCNKVDVNIAVDSAEAAFQKWKKVPARERGKIMTAAARKLEDRKNEIETLLALDTGNALRTQAIPETAASIELTHMFAGLAGEIKGENYPPNIPNTIHYTTKDPIGVVCAIIPWNAPLFLTVAKIAPAIVAGNTVVLKPAETTPLTAMKLAEIIQEADLPPGVVNIVTGAGETGKQLVNHGDINKIAFTGSTDVGKYIMKSVAGSGKKYTLELGGKAANIIFEDAAIDQAVEGIVNSIFFNQGHVCCAGSRLYVQEGVADEVILKLRKRMDSLIVGDPLDKNTDIGAINSKMQLDKIKEYVKLGTDEGGTIFQPSCSLPKKGYWFAPTIFTDVSQSNRIVQEEIFGPVLAIQTFRTVDEVINKANNSPYGLSSGVWTDKGSKIFKVTQDIRAGVIWANTFNKFDPASPFGGYKESGVGSEGGIEGLSGYVNLV